ncbi:hypothetical protein EDF70_112102 [Neorhizobium sp. JUb45]|nr:hypothetical protein EDF70_112102 [Neorhizobium sp. JUb45]
MSLETLIEELCAELMACTDWDERLQFKAEMKLAEQKTAFDAFMSLEPPD